MLLLAHWILMALYILVVPATIALTMLVWRRSRNPAPLASLLVTVMIGLFLGVALSQVYVSAVDGALVPIQMALAAYFATAMLLILKLFDRALRWGLGKILRTDRPDGPARTIRLQLTGVVRVVLLFAVALPYVMAAVMTYRVRVAPKDNPATQLGFEYETVDFRATDGTKLRGWWIPAAPPRGEASDEQWGRRTVLVCHGLGANKSNQLIMARALVPAGYNLLAFDFRAHGESGGQLSTFGDLERYDVLGAVRWLRENRPAQSRKIFGLGASMGAAALIAAAAHDSDEGRAIDALALYAGYDDLEKLASDIARDRFAWPADRIIARVSLPLASLQTGTNLSNFAPGRLAAMIWPRPILLIHGVDDQVIPFARGVSLHDSAHVPKWHVWLEQGGHNDIIENDFVAQVIRRYFDAAEPLPVI